jgi:hypothetical protein
MTNYLLLGYNSGGYKDNLTISFDRTIEKLYKPDPKYPNTPSEITYFHITHSDGTITDEDNSFMEKLILKERGYHESFLVCQIFEINKKSFFEAIETNDIYAAIKLIEAGIDVNIKNEHGQTALHILAKDNCFFEFGQLLEAKADINTKDTQGNTPLDIHIKHKNDKYFIDYLLREGATKKTLPFMKKILNSFQLFLIISMPLIGSPLINLDFSELESLSKMGKQLGKLSKNSTTQKVVIVFKNKKEVLNFHNKYVNKNPEIKSIVKLIPTKPKIFIEENNLYEVIYINKSEKLSFSYYMNNDLSISSLYITIEQQSIPVWTQDSVFNDTKLTPSRSREIFYDGVVRTLYYEYSEKNTKVNIRQELDYDEIYKLQKTILLCNEEDQKIINTELPLSSYIQSFVMNLKKTYRNSVFETTITNQKFTLNEAYKHCNSLSEDGFSVWYLPTVKELLTLSTNVTNKQENNTSIYIKKEYLKVLPQIKNVEDLSFWTSNLSIESGYELGEIISFAYSLDELENSPLDLSSDKNSKHFVLCKKADDVINIRWEDDKFLSIYGNNFRLSPKLKFIGSFNLEDNKPEIIDYKNSEAYFPLKNFLLITYDNKILYILDLNKQKKIKQIKLYNNKKLYLKQIKTNLFSLNH